MENHADECLLGVFHQHAACKCTFLKHVAIAPLTRLKNVHLYIAFSWHINASFFQHILFHHKKWPQENL